MGKHSFSTLRRAVGTIAVVGMLAVSAGPAAADTTPPGDATYSQNGSAAEMFASSCTSNGDDTTTCLDQQIYVFVGKMSDSLTGVIHASQLCAALSIYSVSDLTGEFIGTPTFERGCRVDLPAGSARIDSKLLWATLAPTTVSVEDLACEKFGCAPGSTRDIVVSADWTGFGPLQSSKSRNAWDDSVCRTHEAFKGSNRQADVTGSLDGHDLASDRFAYLSSGKYTFRSSCAEA
ncbi:MAG TPA: hypothetical protein VN773_00960 [Verrucomicrobiae bacterium]|nr:hypothetical protein [Verrucomicrobiae bacterium]